MAKRRENGVPGVSFSWKRATGVTAAKRKLATCHGGAYDERPGGNAEVGKALGCCVPLAFVVIGLGAASYASAEYFTSSRRVQRLADAGIEWGVQCSDILAAISAALRSKLRESRMRFASLTTHAHAAQTD